MRTQLSFGVMAHRGNMSEFPENTMASFESAIDIGAGWIELDIQRTLDGLLVVTHDETAKRVADANVKISATSYADLKTLNFGSYMKDGKFYGLPLLEEVLELSKHAGIRVSIQPKNNGLVKDAIKLAKEIGVINQIGFNDINCEYLIEVKQVDSKIPVFWDRLPGTDFETDLFISKKFGFETLMYLKEAITEAKIESVIKSGIRFGACVVNDQNDMKKFIGWGVESFYTDYPKQLLKLLAQPKN